MASSHFGGCALVGKLRSIEICAGAGGQALGLEQAGFAHLALIELDPEACQTLRNNRPAWNTLQWDLHTFSAEGFRGQVDLFAGGVPCPPFSVASKQLGAGDERDLFPRALDLVEQCEPKAVMLENVRGLLDPKFEGYRQGVLKRLSALGFEGEWKLLNASGFGVPQLRPRALLVGLRPEYYRFFSWPDELACKPTTVGEALYKEMAADGWEGACEWAKGAGSIAPTIVGGSKKHGGPDLGPTRAKMAWAKLGVNAHSIAEDRPQKGFVGMPRLTGRMAAMIQGFDPDEWEFAGKKTSAYRQVGNACPPPVAQAVGTAIVRALKTAKGKA